MLYCICVQDIVYISRNSKHKDLCSIPINKRIKMEINYSRCTCYTSSWLMAPWDIMKTFEWENTSWTYLAVFDYLHFPDSQLRPYSLAYSVPISFVFLQFSQASSYFADVRTIFQICTSGSKSHSQSTCQTATAYQSFADSKLSTEMSRYASVIHTVSGTWLIYRVLKISIIILFVSRKRWQPKSKS